VLSCKSAKLSLVIYLRFGKKPVILAVRDRTSSVFISRTACFGKGPNDFLIPLLPLLLETHAGRSAAESLSEVFRTRDRVYMSVYMSMCERLYVRVHVLDVQINSRPFCENAMLVYKNSNYILICEVIFFSFYIFLSFTSS
jgi:hypothetical protein